MRLRLLRGEHGPVWLVGRTKIAPNAHMDATGAYVLDTGVRVRVK